MVRNKIDDRKFVRTFVKAYNERRSLRWIAAQMDISYSSATQKANKLRKKGVKLPALKYPTDIYQPTVDELNELVSNNVKG